MTSPPPALLVFGPASRVLPTTPADREVLLTCLVPDPAPGRHRASLIVDRAAYDGSAWQLWSAGALAGTALPDPPGPWLGPAPSPAFRSWLESACRSHLGAPPPGDLAPLAMVRAGTAPGTVEILLAGQFTRDRFNVVRARAVPFEGGFEAGAVLRHVLPHLAEHHDEIAVECWTYVKYHRGVEIEEKLAVPADCAISVWDLATRFLQELDAGRLEHFAGELKDHFQQYVRHNTMFEVLAPEDQRGYVSFIRTPDGTHRLKRKIFAEDALRRREKIHGSVDLAGRTPAAYLAGEFPDLSVRLLPEFRRSRLDVNAESLTTGHVYAVIFDESRVVGDDGAVLRQVEIEYLRSRRHTGLEPAAIEPEFATLVDAVSTLLKGWGVPCERTYYSKLSFLRDHVARRPDRSGDL